MVGGVPWLPLVVVGAGFVSAAFIRFLWPYRHRPGGWFFIATRLVAWGVRTLGGDLPFDVDESGTTATLVLPLADA